MRKEETTLEGVDDNDDNAAALADDAEDRENDNPSSIGGGSFCWSKSVAEERLHQQTSLNVPSNATDPRNTASAPARFDDAIGHKNFYNFSGAGLRVQHFQHLSQLSGLVGLVLWEKHTH